MMHHFVPNFSQTSQTLSLTETFFFKFGHFQIRGACPTHGLGVKTTLFGDHIGQTHKSFIKFTPLILAIECQNK